MDEETLQSVIEEGLAIISSKRGLSPLQLSEKAGKLLIIVAKLAQFRNYLEQELTKHSSLERVTYAQVMSQADKSAKVTEKKVLIESDSTYISSREKMEEIQSSITYVKTMIDVMNNGHVLFRQLMREDS
jgi:hypothetical protein